MHDLATDVPPPLPDRKVMFKRWSDVEAMRLEKGVVLAYEIRCCYSGGEFASEITTNCSCAGKWLHGFKYSASKHAAFAQSKAVYPWLAAAR